MDILNLAMRWLHIIPAIALVGGTLFMRFAVVPAYDQLDDEQREKIQESLLRFLCLILMEKMMPLKHVCSLSLIFSIITLKRLKD